MKKKILAIVLCVAMLAIAIVGGKDGVITDFAPPCGDRAARARDQAVRQHQQCGAQRVFRRAPNLRLHDVTPAEAGVHPEVTAACRAGGGRQGWIPAFAGMTWWSN